MAQNRATRRSIDRVPAGLRPLVGSVVLAGGVKLVDALWTRFSGYRPPGASPASEPSLGGGATIPAGSHGERDGTGTGTADDDTGPRTVRDRLLYALLLGGMLRLAQRVGLAPEGRRRGHRG